MAYTKGLTLVYTGEGKGKTTAAVGLAIRAHGNGKRVCMIQFIKSSDRLYGEKTDFDQLGMEIYQTGIGFTWKKTPEEHREALRQGFQLARDKINSGHYDLVILDELNNALAIERFPIADVLPLDEVIALIQNRPKELHLVITGRSANDSILGLADLVTEMRPIKHYYEEGIPAVEGIEY
ncbi:cob(I)yrinic acid a,c-diamide adenosyltransferase [Brevibacillus ginsengisoli]|uniref:cob(I)yrinic acid a,c-diamide adenosyltransferase n=1 Tax=Brevibacillus ginsengisoli TaxID=363854 RepID=UPI003CEB91F8